MVIRFILPFFILQPHSLSLRMNSSIDSGPNLWLCSVESSEVGAHQWSDGWSLFLKSGRWRVGRVKAPCKIQLACICHGKALTVVRGVKWDVNAHLCQAVLILPHKISPVHKNFQWFGSIHDKQCIRTYRINRKWHTWIADMVLKLRTS